MNSNNEYIKFQVSDDLFWGYTHSILRSNLLAINNEQQRQIYICNEVKNSLNTMLKQLNLVNLTEKLTNVNFHIHGYNNILASIDPVIYICGHC